VVVVVLVLDVVVVAGVPGPFGVHAPRRETATIAGMRTSAFDRGTVVWVSFSEAMKSPFVDESSEEFVSDR